MPLTHELLAEMLGVQRSIVSATLRGLQGTGLIEQHRGFHQLEEGTGARIRYRKVSEGSGEEVPQKKIVKCY